MTPIFPVERREKDYDCSGTWHASELSAAGRAGHAVQGDRNVSHGCPEPQ